MYLWNPTSPAPANRLSEASHLLAPLLRARGLRTGAIVNNLFLAPVYGLNRGFEVYDYEPGDNRTIRRADVTVTRALDLIDTWNDRVFFLVVHLFDPHMSYAVPPPFRGVFTQVHDSQLTLPVEDLQTLQMEPSPLTETDWEFIRAAYDEEIRFVDEQLGRFRAGLAARDLLDTSLIILTADHGEELLDHGGFEHGHALWQELLRVPLVVWGPGVAPGREAGAVSLVDVAPTILEWLGADPHDDLDGHSLLASSSGEPPPANRELIAEGLLHVYPQTAVLRWPLKLVVDNALMPIHAFDMQADPLETIDLLPGGLGGVTTLIEVLQARAQSAPLPDELPAGFAVDDEMLERLRSLGYIR